MTKFPLLRVGYNNYRPRFWMNETNLPNEMSFEAVYINTFIGRLEEIITRLFPAVFIWFTTWKYCVALKNTFFLTVFYWQFHEQGRIYPFEQEALDLCPLDP